MGRVYNNTSGTLSVIDTGSGGGTERRSSAGRTAGEPVVRGAGLVARRRVAGAVQDSSIGGAVTAREVVPLENLHDLLAPLHRQTISTGVLLWNTGEISGHQRGDRWPSLGW